ncbi:unnamed protein product [Cylicocyclus nassatus]|uniref:Uncharacterized protein n=1 Tax=Cylicocyclus nassatus TaxID=53992 RepID=A0AA36HGE0_CYLNA|nr:unnamed protein product [Cylicocyclus nassatus]
MRFSSILPLPLFRQIARVIQLRCRNNPTSHKNLRNVNKLCQHHMVDFERTTFLPCSLKLQPKAPVFVHQIQDVER